MAQRALSPVEIIDVCLDRIARLDGRLHSFLEVYSAQALDDARKAERELASGFCRGPMHGLPVGLKDMIDVAGRVTTVNSAARRDRMATQDARLVSALREAGAVVLGKQALGEFMMGGTQFDLPWPPPRNPWSLDRDPSNSSSGSAVAVAAGLCPAAVGSDTGGSIRGPAAWCGIAGLKPSHGLVDRCGTVEYSPSLDHLGPMAWTVEDCAILLDAMTGRTGFHAAIGGAVAGLRVGLVRGFFEYDSQLDATVSSAMEDTIRIMAELGVVVEDVALSPVHDFGRAAATISMAEGFAAHGAEVERNSDVVGAATLRRMRASGGVSAERLAAAHLKRAELTVQVDAVLAKVDYLILPTAKHSARELGYDALRGDSFLNRPLSLTGHPALALCNGFDKDGMPVSLQVVGRHGHDAGVLRLGSAVERALGLRHRRPAIAEQ